MHINIPLGNPPVELMRKKKKRKKSEVCDGAAFPVEAIYLLL